MRANRNLLNNLMESVISEWGPEEVMRAFQNVASGFPALTQGSHSDVLHRRSKHAQVSALSLTERASVPDEKLAALRLIAERFDAKTFLPNPADIREFLISLGLRPKAFRDRGAAFKLVLQQITPLSTDTLQQIANSSMFSGPARLGPLADAIAEAASSRRAASSD